MKAIKQYFPVVLFSMLYKVVLTFKSVDLILKCDHSNECFSAEPSCGAFCFSVFFKLKFKTFHNFFFYFGHSWV